MPQRRRHPGQIPRIRNRIPGPRERYPPRRQPRAGPQPRLRRCERRAAVEQARARYRSGLGTALEVADAQRRLAQAEIDDSLARLNTWRARLAWYAAQGDIAPLLTEASQ